MQQLKGLISLKKKSTQKKARKVQFYNVNCDGNSNNIPSISAG